MPQIQLQGISKTFSNTKAVNKVSLTIPEGIIFGLLGPNGAGKTTLIRIITNIIASDEGQIFFDGKQVKGLDPLDFGYMPEERGLYKKMMVGEQLMYLTQLKGMPAKQAKANILNWVDKFEIRDWWKKKVTELSKGMQQKVQFISTIAHQPSLIILDEPFSGLDPINTDLIKTEIFELAKAGATILFSTHRMEQVDEICEQIALINKGEVILQGGVDELKQQFKQHEFEIIFSGTLDEGFQNFDDSAATSFFEVEEQTNSSLKVKLLEGYTSNQLLEYMLQQGISINSFKELLPSINEIFINQVGGQSNE